ncbi:MAG: DUF4157 domain-containing protein [Gammaproteobacteria bacterium]|nr:DUF4157 domain-containing protein [Gammaproteobacteria bacterium]MBU1723010.1 DUF4157 domain-containing protein [Gammaproteobacteria bacterium]MBU2003811.1 DUF4157 domain-containing protein [Gammaproteobacteria bacterium]
MSTPTPTEHQLCPACPDKLQRQPQPVTTKITPVIQMQSSSREPATPTETSTGQRPGINALQNGGSPLPPQTRHFFESRFGTDFRPVRIHTGSLAARTSEMLNAQAFTVGNNIVFGAGQYAPDTFSGKSLLAHELTHVVQQAGGSSFASPYIQRRIVMRTLTPTFWSWLLPFLVDPDESLHTMTDAEVDAYISGIGSSIHAYDDIISGIDAITGAETEYEFVGGRTRRARETYRSELITQIIRDMHDAADDLFYDSDAELESEVRKRALLSLRMRVTQGRTSRARPTGYPPACGRDPGPRVSEAARPYWDVREPAGKSYHFTLTGAGRADAYEALRTLLFTHRTDPCLRTLMHCDYMITALQYITMADSMGRSNFNHAVSSGEINLDLTWDGFLRVTGSAGNTENKSLQTVTINSEDDLIIGDHVIFWNHEAYNDLNQVQVQSWRLENAFVIDSSGRGGTRRFQGHGFFSPHTREHFINAMVSKINTLVNIAIRHVGNNSVSGLRRDFEFTRSGTTFNPIAHDFTGGRIRNAEIQYHEHGLWEDSDMGNTILSRPLRRFTPADFPTPFVRPGATEIVVKRPIESIRESL